MRPTKKQALEVLLAGAFCLGGQFPSLSAEPDDMALTLAARRVLADDRTLAQLNLGVRVADGTATLMGPVPAAVLARWAETAVQRISGIRAVVSELNILPPNDPIVEKMARAARQAKEARPPEPVVFAPITGQPPTQIAWEPPSPTERVAAKPTLSPAPQLMDTPARVVRASATLLEPVAMSTDAGALSRRIEAMRSGDARLGGLQVDIQNGIVRLTGNAKNRQHLWPFAEAVSHLPGVERVIIEK
jgi:hypothetical protein